jgi:hypothetical protein
MRSALGSCGPRSVPLLNFTRVIDGSQPKIPPGEMTAAMYSFMASCKKNNLNEFEWFKDVFERIQSINHKDLYQLLPSSWPQYWTI